MRSPYTQSADAARVHPRVLVLRDTTMGALLLGSLGRDRGFGAPLSVQRVGVSIEKHGQQKSFQQGLFDSLGSTVRRARRDVGACTYRSGCFSAHPQARARKARDVFQKSAVFARDCTYLDPFQDGYRVYIRPGYRYDDDDRLFLKRVRKSDSP